jgi:hypothetical protein
MFRDQDIEILNDGKEDGNDKTREQSDGNDGMMTEQWEIGRK